MTFIQKNSYLLAILFLCILFSVIGIYSNQSLDTYDEITVHEGDTLWDLARQYGEQPTTDRWIQEVITLNNLPSSKIRVGETLKIPPMAPPMLDTSFTELAGNEEQ